MRSGSAKGIGLCLILCGLCVFLYPDGAALFKNAETKRFVTAYEKKLREPAAEADRGEACDPGEKSTAEQSTAEQSAAEESAAEESTAVQSTAEESIAGEKEPEEDDLLRRMRNYNTALYENLQFGLMDADSVLDFSPELFGTEEAFGYVEIPAMKLLLPLYLGASEANMAKGLAVMGQTSIPIGGENSNCVIAGHRGYQGLPFLRDIEELQPGDEVCLTNPWQRLTYLVTEIHIIDPYDVEALKIREGKDMLTLMTCHPYRSHGKYRYLVCCERREKEERMDTMVPEEIAKEETLEKCVMKETEEGCNRYAFSEEEIISSREDIALEQQFRRGAAGLILGMLAIALWKEGREKRKR